jgi:hypothetical protein
MRYYKGTARGQGPMSEWMWLLLAVLAWIVLTQVVLPRFGIRPT